MQFVNEKYLLMYWALIPVAFVLWLALRKQFARLMAFNSKFFTKTMTRSPSRSRMYFKGFLMLSALATLITALAGPRWGFDWREVKRSGLDVMIALDVSKSMMAEDFKPNRLERAKREIIDLLEMVEGDRVGLLAFAGTAFVQCPLTMDYSATRMFIEYLNPGLIPVQGTALGEAVLLATNRLKESSPDSSRGQAIIVLSDGEDQGEKVDAAIKQAKEAGIKVYTVGIGSPEGAPIPDESGGFKKDNAGNLILSKYHESTLKKLAEDTGGKYVRSIAGDLDLKEIYFGGIRGLKDGDLEGTSQREKVWHERFQIFLLLSFFLLLLDGGISRTAQIKSKKTTVTEKNSRSKQILVGLLLLVFWPIPSKADEREDAHKKFNNKEFSEAAKAFEQAEVDNPEDPSITYNKGVSLYKSGEYDRAIDAFTKSMNSENEKLKEVSQFNLANAQVKAGKLEDGIKNYEEILNKYKENLPAKENLDFARKLLEQKKQEQQKNQENKDNQDKKDNQENDAQDKQQNNQSAQNNEQNKDQKNQGESQNQDQEKKDEPNQTAQNQEKDSSKQENNKKGDEEQKDEAASNEENEKDSKEEGDSDSQKEQTAAGKPEKSDKISKQEAQRLLRSIDDKMAKYMVKPSKEELSKYRQENVENDW